MDFEQSLVYEIKSIIPIYPLESSQNVKAPYSVYRMENRQYVRALMENHLDIVISSYEISIYHQQYSQVKVLLKQVEDKIKTFFKRSIGQGGPYIQDIKISNSFEMKEPFVNEYRGVIEFEVTY